QARSRMKNAGEDRVECFDNNGARSKFRDLLCSGTRQANFEAQGSQWIHATEDCLSVERSGGGERVPNASPGNCEKQNIRETNRLLRRARASLGSDLSYK